MSDICEKEDDNAVEMIEKFSELKEGSRIWLYQADRKLDKKEQETILSKANAFISNWAAHGQALLASSSILHDYFLVIAADEDFHMASGCSIDSQFRFVQELGQEMSIDFFNRTNLAFLVEDKVQMISMSQLKSEIEKGNIQPNSTFFDNNVKNIGELKTIWLKTAGDSWLTRYFKAQKNVI